MPGGDPPTTRRTALGGLLALAAVSACSVDDLRPPEDDPEPSSPAPSETTAQDADGQLVEAVVVEIVQTLGQVGSARRFPNLRDDLGGLARMHRAHLAVLEPDREVPGPRGRPASADRALRQVRATEEGLQRRLAQAAVEARSGSLARLLASMSAAVAQHAATLPSRPRGGGA